MRLLGGIGSSNATPAAKDGGPRRTGCRTNESGSPGGFFRPPNQRATRLAHSRSIKTPQPDHSNIPGDRRRWLPSMRAGRSSNSIHQPFSRSLIALDDLAAGLDPELPAQSSHALAVFQPNHEGRRSSIISNSFTNFSVGTPSSGSSCQLMPLSGVHAGYKDDSPPGHASSLLLSGLYGAGSISRFEIVACKD